MDSNIQERLKETSQNCLEAFINWESKKKELKAQEELHVAIHELRKVSSRLEIELAMSERAQVTSKPLPIPAHRSNMKGDVGAILEGNNDDIGNKEKVSTLAQNMHKSKRRRPPSPVRKNNED
jgi:hypothetical protein